MIYLLHLKLIAFFLAFTPMVVFSQITNDNFIFGKEFSKDIALTNSKKFLLQNIIGTSANVVPFEITPLAAAGSGELTTLLYRCYTKNKEGLILGFYGYYWNETGVVYQGYGFKNFETEEAVKFLNAIQNAIDRNLAFMQENTNNNNIYFSFDDIDVLICANEFTTYTIRLFWKSFDATWEKTAFTRSKRRFDKNTK